LFCRPDILIRVCREQILLPVFAARALFSLFSFIYNIRIRLLWARLLSQPDPVINEIIVHILSCTLEILSDFEIDLCHLFILSAIHYVT